MKLSFEKSVLHYWQLLDGDESKGYILKIKWKQQHINNSCASACLAMLLSNYGIDKEDYDVIEESKMPYLIKYDKENDSYHSGMLVQNDEIFNIMTLKYRMEFFHNEFKNWDEYFRKAKELLTDNIPFMTGISIKFIPSSGYDNAKNITSSHAIVIDNFKNNCFHILDPDAGLLRDKRYNFDEIKEFVCLNITLENFRKGIENKKGKKFLIGYLNNSKSSNNIDFNKLIQQSKRAIELYPQRIQNIKNKFVDNEKNSYEDFHSFIIRYIKPLAIDLKNALKTIKNKNNPQNNLIETLQNYQNFVLEFQIKVQNMNMNYLEFFEEIFIRADEIKKLILQHLKSV
ncbi:MAG: C39 family peptidase [Candidatus Cloacimonetes bacterium]|nr:C39 family peptidase [Candidatus Cloacimonadota bacterium]